MNKYPLIKFVILFICGIIFQSIINIKFSILLVVFISLLIISAFLVASRKDYLTQYKNYFIIISVLIFGSIYFSFSNISNATYPFKNPKIKNIIVNGKVISIDLIEEKKLTFTIKAENISISNRNPIKKFNVLVNLYDSDKSINTLYAKLRIGNRIELKGTLFRPRNERHPCCRAKKMVSSGSSAEAVDWLLARRSV